MLSFLLGCIITLPVSAQQKIQSDEKARSVTARPFTIDTTGQPDPVVDTPDVKAKMDTLLWNRHLGSKLQRLLMPASKIPPGTYTIRIQFIIEKDGSISTAKALDHPGYGMAEFARKVILTAPKWTPAQLNGENVRSRYTQAVTIMINPKN